MLRGKTKKEINPLYNHRQIELGKFKSWENSNLFKPGQNLRKEKFSMILPPPNMTGVIHLGHALNSTIQDIIARKKRMEGYDVLHIPGFDHGGISSQTKLEEVLLEKGIDKNSLTSYQFVEEMWKLKNSYVNKIKTELALLGIGLDYSKERFTFDKKSKVAVDKVFSDLYEDGLVYEGKEVLDWDVKEKTVLSEVDSIYKKINGKLYHLRYNISNEFGYVDVVTTRPETIFADSALMVNPSDDRYSKYIGSKVTIPGTNRIIPIIEDYSVDIKEGTGCLRVTPFMNSEHKLIAEEHNFEIYSCIDERGKMTGLAGEYSGLDRFECRHSLIGNLQESGECFKIEDHKYTIKVNKRTGNMLEPRLTSQWFLSMDKFKKEFTDIDISVFPKRFNKQLKKYMDSMTDWPISRQFLWGHQLPVYYNLKTNEVKVSNSSPGINWKRSEDTLDPLFSSSLWPFLSLGWPTKTTDLDKYYPNSLLVTGEDMFNSWVSKMIMNGLYFTKKLPFEECLVHGLVKDKQGNKMSTSLQNTIEITDLVEQYGADSLRFYLSTNSKIGEDLVFNETKLENVWNFANTVWKVSREVFLNTKKTVKGKIKFRHLTDSDKFILDKLNSLIEYVNKGYIKYKFKDIGRELIKFLNEDYVLWYMEASKIEMNSRKIKTSNKHLVMREVLITYLKLLHPFMPFLTDEIYVNLFDKKSSIMTSEWPISNSKNTFMYTKTEVEHMRTVVDMVDNLRKMYDSDNKIEVLLLVDDKETRSVFEENISILEEMMGTRTLYIKNKYKPAKDTIELILKGIKIYVAFNGLIDKDKEIKKISKEISEINKEIFQISSRLEDPEFIKKASKETIRGEEMSLVKLKEHKESLKENLKKFK
jgi:valyl-tRNA synthetase